MAFNPHAYLNSFANFEAHLQKLQAQDFHLDRIQGLLAAAGQPQDHLKIVHVAGTKGKGSTCAFLSRILQEAGYSVGLYTSPHLHRVNERIRILNSTNLITTDPLSGSIVDKELALALQMLQPLIEDIQERKGFLTYFEVLTAAAICHFAQAKVDIVILETGLGGRLDATNAMDAMIAVITPISLDHMHVLGNTIGQIAAEKAGIIKNAQQHVVISPQHPEAMQAIQQRCQQLGVRSVVADPVVVQPFSLALKGQHQAVNAAVAIEVVHQLKELGWTITDKDLSRGLANVRWPGRFEVLRRNPDIIVDCAHNEASVKALAATVRQEYPHHRVIVVLGTSQDKDVVAICRELNTIVSHVILTKANHPRAHVFTLEEAKKNFIDKPCEIINAVDQAMAKALQIAGSQDIVLVTGSVFLVADVRHMIKL